MMMVTIMQLLATALRSRFWSRARLYQEILILRHQLNVLRPAAPQRVSLTNTDRFAPRLVLPGLAGPAAGGGHIATGDHRAWHRQGFRAYWRRRSRALPGRSRISKSISDLTREVSSASPLSGIWNMEVDE